MVLEVGADVGEQRVDERPRVSGEWSGSPAREIRMLSTLAFTGASLKYRWELDSKMPQEGRLTSRKLRSGFNGSELTLVEYLLLRRWDPAESLER